MLADLLVALLSMGQAASAGPAPSPAPAAPPPVRSDGCDTRTNTDSRTIVVCAPKPEGYRIDPDVLEARREHRKRSQPPAPPYRTMQANSCGTVGPMGCRGNLGIDLVNAAGVLAQMATRASGGGNVGEMFVTDPQPSEYQLYVEARKRRQADEAQKAAKAKAAAARAPRIGPADSAPAQAASPPAAAP